MGIGCSVWAGWILPPNAPVKEPHLWIFKSYEDRNDNLLCAAVVLETVLVVKTVMHHFDPEA